VLLGKGSWWRQIEEHLDEEIVLLGEGVIRTWARKKIERGEEAITPGSVSFFKSGVVKSIYTFFTWLELSPNVL
jgi:hypothetical protein